MGQFQARHRGRRLPALDLLPAGRHHQGRQVDHLRLRVRDRRLGRPRLRDRHHHHLRPALHDRRLDRHLPLLPRLCHPCWRMGWTKCLCRRRAG